METKDWIVMTGQPIDSTKGGGFEFFGPFTESEADQIRTEILNASQHGNGTWIVMAVQLLGYYNRKLKRNE